MLSRGCYHHRLIWSKAYPGPRIGVDTSGFVSTQLQTGKLWRHVKGGKMDFGRSYHQITNYL